MAKIALSALEKFILILGIMVEFRFITLHLIDRSNAMVIATCSAHNGSYMFGLSLSMQDHSTTHLQDVLSFLFVCFCFSLCFSRFLHWALRRITTSYHSYC